MSFKENVKKNWQNKPHDTNKIIYSSMTFNSRQLLQNTTDHLPNRLSRTLHRHAKISE